MLLVDHDEPQFLQRSKHGTPRADDNPRPTGADLMPLVMAFPLREVAVQHCDLLLLGGKAAFEALHGLGSQGDFRHQHDCRAPLL